MNRSCLLTRSVVGDKDPTFTEQHVCAMTEVGTRKNGVVTFRILMTR